MDLRQLQWRCLHAVGRLCSEESCQGGFKFSICIVYSNIHSNIFIGGHQKASCAEGHPSKSPGCQQRRLVGLQALLQVQQAVGGLRQGADRLETSSRLLVGKLTEYFQSQAQLKLPILANLLHIFERLNIDIPIFFQHSVGNNWVIPHKETKQTNTL